MSERSADERQALIERMGNLRSDDPLCLIRIKQCMEEDARLLRELHPDEARRESIGDQIAIASGLPTALERIAYRLADKLYGTAARPDDDK